MDANYSRQYSIYNGTIGTVAAPLLGASAGSLGFTQAQIDDADAILISVQTADINFRVVSDGTLPGTGVGGGHAIASGTSLFMRGQNQISKLQFIAKGSTAGIVNITIYGGK